MDISVTLAGEEWDQVLDLLGDGSFKRASPLIKKIIDQARAQQQQDQETERPRLQPVS